MNVLSLFDGMSCGQIALNRAGIQYDNYYASEIDKHAIKVTQANYPNTVQLGDITKWREWDLPQIDLIMGGSPCQGFSFAGKQLNFDDPRSKLFWVFVDILRHYKPRYFLLENVKMKKESERVITEALGVEPVMIDSALVSAQSRKRLYWTNIPNVTQPSDKGVMLQDILEDGYVDRDKSYCIDASYFKGGNEKSYFEKGRRQLVFRDKAYVLRATQASKISQSVINRYFDKHIDNVLIDEGTFRILNPTECETLQTVPNDYTNYVSNSQRYKMLGNGWTVDVIVHIFKGIQ